MIECLTGKVIHIETEAIVIDVHGVGYLVYCANPFRFQEWLDETKTVYTYQHVREDAIQLFGFLNREERRLFEKLLQVSGIGPKGALAILASGEPKTVIQAIEEENERFLVKFPGVGKKTARQMILDLKGKLPDVMPSLFEDEYSDETSSRFSESDPNKELNEAVEALKALGYVEREINKVLPEIKEQQLSTDEYIKKALQLMLQR
ncbi:Holliday junction branch migration protein RuvA [Bacillus shivajii]|uniref:Holliday junction branch migration protein RuvA n=1 Tax=Bacillus shivajii TaxID=1983719 RepID=UPI001CFBF3B9|nr:Holliday junction branch migration protein RuvA [Bacillus shivajii]UCZ54347.1 Holliday junction branch migration protein RuvA [Bacillus shivajii]